MFIFIGYVTGIIYMLKQLLMFIIYTMNKIFADLMYGFSNLHFAFRIQYRGDCRIRDCIKRLDFMIIFKIRQ